MEVVDSLLFDGREKAADAVPEAFFLRSRAQRLVCCTLKRFRPFG